MAYEKQTWINDDENSQLSAERLNHIEQGIYNAHNIADDATIDLTLLAKSFDGDLAKTTPANNFYLTWDLLTKTVGLHVGDGTNQSNDTPSIQREISISLDGIAKTSDLELTNTAVTNLSLDTVHNISVNGVTLEKDNGTIALTIPEKLSDLTDDLDYTRLKVKTASDSLSDVRNKDFIFELED